MILRQAVSQIRTLMKLTSSDNTITNRALADELRSTAMQLIKRETDKRRLLASSTIFTEIPCIELEKVPLAECCNYRSDCEISRSKYKLPKIAENIYGVLTQGVYSIDKKQEFNFIDVDRYINYLNIYKNKKYKKETFYWITNGYLYITNPNIETVRISAYFEEDVDFSLYTCGECKECPDNPLDLEFKCPGYLVPNVLSVVRDTLLKTYKRSVQDNTENDKDEAL